MLQKANRSKGQAFCSVIAESTFPGMSQLGLFAIWFSAEKRQVQFYLLGKAVTCLKTSSTYSLIRMGTHIKSWFLFVTVYWHLKLYIYEWPHGRFLLFSIVEV